MKRYSVPAILAAVGKDADKYFLDKNWIRRQDEEMFIVDDEAGEYETGIEKYEIYKHFYLNSTDDGEGNFSGHVQCVKKGSSVKDVLLEPINTIKGNMYIFDLGLTSLEGSPKIVSGSFNCSDNNLETLKGAPEYVGGNFGCMSNKLKNLDGIPKEIKGSFICKYNPFESEPGVVVERTYDKKTYEIVNYSTNV